MYEKGSDEETGGRRCRRLSGISRHSRYRAGRLAGCADHGSSRTSVGQSTGDHSGHGSSSAKRDERVPGLRSGVQRPQLRVAHDGVGVDITDPGDDSTDGGGQLAPSACGLRVGALALRRATGASQSRRQLGARTHTVLPVDAAQVRLDCAQAGHGHRPATLPAAERLSARPTVRPGVCRVPHRHAARADRSTRRTRAASRALRKPSRERGNRADGLLPPRLATRSSFRSRLLPPGCSRPARIRPSPATFPSARALRSAQIASLRSPTAGIPPVPGSTVDTAYPR